MREEGKKKGERNKIGEERNKKEGIKIKMK